MAAGLSLNRCTADVSLNKTLYPQLYTGSNRPDMNEKLLIAVTGTYNMIASTLAKPWRVIHFKL